MLDAKKEPGEDFLEQMSRLANQIADMIPGIPATITNAEIFGACRRVIQMMETLLGVDRRWLDANWERIQKQIGEVDALIVVAEKRKYATSRKQIGN